MTVEIYLQSAIASSYPLPELAQFQTWVHCVIDRHNYLKAADSVELTIRLVDITESARLNYKYRHKSGPTNVLSFPTERSSQTSTIYLGDLVICVPLVDKEATEQGKDIMAHWTHLTIHGVLHLLGYDHEEENEATFMESIEIELLASLGFKNPYSN